MTHGFTAIPLWPFSTGRKDLDRWARFIRRGLKETTGIVGLPVDPDARSNLLSASQAVLAAVQEKVPAEARYRADVESTFNYWLDQVGAGIRRSMCRTNAVARFHRPLHRCPIMTALRLRRCMSARLTAGLTQSTAGQITQRAETLHSRRLQQPAGLKRAQPPCTPCFSPSSFPAWALSAQLNSSAADEEVEEALQFQLEELTQVTVDIVALALSLSNERGEPWAALHRLRGG